MATGISVNEFSGGPETNIYLNNVGFEVIKLRQTTLGVCAAEHFGSSE
jgi:hypothetical protein